MSPEAYTQTARSVNAWLDLPAAVDFSKTQDMPAKLKSGGWVLPPVQQPCIRVVMLHHAAGSVRAGKPAAQSRQPPACHTSA